MVHAFESVLKSSEKGSAIVGLGSEDGESMGAEGLAAVRGDVGDTEGPADDLGEPDGAVATPDCVPHAVRTSVAHATTAKYLTIGQR